MEYEPIWRPNISDICRDFYKLSEKFSETNHIDNYYNNSGTDPMSLHDNQTSTAPITIKILSVEEAIREHKSTDGKKQIAWDSFKYHSSTNIDAKYWLGYYYFHHGEDIPELQRINRKERIKTAVEIFRETA